MKRLIPLFVLLILASCGARKTQKSELEMEVKTVTEFAKKDTAAVKINIDTNIITTVTKDRNSSNGSVIETITDEPIDPTKPAYVIDSQGDKTELNNVKRVKQIKLLKLTETDKEVYNIQFDEKAAQDSRKLSQTSGSQTSELNISQSDKETEREQMSFKFLWWLIPLLIILFLLIRYIYKKIPLL